MDMNRMIPTPKPTATPAMPEPPLPLSVTRSVSRRRRLRAKSPTMSCRTPSRSRRAIITSWRSTDDNLSMSLMLDALRPAYRAATPFSVLSSNTRYPTRCFGWRTSLIAADSAAGSSAAETTRTLGRMESVAFAPPRALSPISALAIRAPNPTPVASMIAMWRTLLDAPVRAISTEAPKIAVINAGTASVPMMNQRERTRSRNSRFATMKILLSMARHPRLDASSADALQEDLMERRLHQLEPFDLRAAIDEPTQQNLRIRTWCQLQLEVVVGVIDLLHELVIAQQLTDAIVCSAGEQ